MRAPVTTSLLRYRSSHATSIAICGRQSRHRAPDLRDACVVWYRSSVAQAPGRKVCDTILDAIGYTPMVRIKAITREVTDADVLVKLETFNPGNSIKDRIAVKMIEDA